MLISHKLIFEVARKIAIRHGQTIPVLQLDPLIEFAKLYVEDGLQISYTQQLVADESNHICSAERVIIRTPIDWDTVDEEVSDEEKDILELVFDTIHSDNLDLSFAYVPDVWIDRLQEIQNAV